MRCRNSRRCPHSRIDWIDRGPRCRWRHHHTPCPGCSTRQSGCSGTDSDHTCRWYKHPCRHTAPRLSSNPGRATPRNCCFGKSGSGKAATHHSRSRSRNIPARGAPRTPRPHIGCPCRPGHRRIPPPMRTVDHNPESTRAHTHRHHRRLLCTDPDRRNSRLHHTAGCSREWAQTRNRPPAHRHPWCNVPRQNKQQARSRKPLPRTD